MLFRSDPQLPQSLSALVKLDRLGRAELAKNFIAEALQTERPFNTAVCSPFGGGKTFFLHLLAANLREKNAAAIFVDISAHQSTGSPIGSILEELRAFADERNLVSPRLKKNFAQAITKSAKIAGRLGLKIGLKLATGAVVDDADIGKVVMGDAEKRVDELFNKYETKKQIDKDIRASLSELVKTIVQDGQYSDSRIFLFVDELDRCEPEYFREFLSAFRYHLDGTGLSIIVGFDDGRFLAPVASGQSSRQSFAGEDYIEKYFDIRIRLDPTWQGAIVGDWLARNPRVRKAIHNLWQYQYGQKSRTTSLDDDAERHFVTFVSDIFYREGVSLRQSMKILEHFAFVTRADEMFFAFWRSTIYLCLKYFADYNTYRDTVRGYYSYDQLREMFKSYEEKRLLDLEILLYANNMLDVLDDGEIVEGEFEFVERRVDGTRSIKTDLIDALFRRLLFNDSQGWHHVVTCVKSGGTLFSQQRPDHNFAFHELGPRMKSLNERFISKSAYLRSRSERPGKVHSKEYGFSLEGFLKSRTYICKPKT